MSHTTSGLRLLHKHICIVWLIRHLFTCWGQLYFTLRFH